MKSNLLFNVLTVNEKFHIDLTFKKNTFLAKFHLICCCGNLVETQLARNSTETVPFYKISTPGD